MNCTCGYPEEHTCHCQWSHGGDSIVECGDYTECNCPCHNRQKIDEEELAYLRHNKEGTPI